MSYAATLRGLIKQEHVISRKLRGAILAETRIAYRQAIEYWRSGLDVILGDVGDGYIPFKIIPPLASAGSLFHWLRDPVKCARQIRSWKHPQIQTVPRRFRAKSLNTGITLVGLAEYYGIGVQEVEDALDRLDRHLDRRPTLSTIEDETTEEFERFGHSLWRELASIRAQIFLLKG